MAKRVVESTIGIDVSKRWLDICADEGAVHRIENSAAAIGQWLQQLSGPLRLAVEPTSSYHELLIRSAHAAGHPVYLIDALRLSRYREAVGQRAKTDPHDARLLRRYLMQEAAQLRPWQPVAAGAEQLWRLLKRRATLVRAEVQVRQSLATLEHPPAAAQLLQQQFQVLLRDMERQLIGLARSLGWAAQLARLRQVPGIGALTAVGLLAAWQRGEFYSADRFVAFLGLDVRVRDSGQYRGRRKLSKKGEPELRRLLYTAAMSACHTPCWKAYYERLRVRGLTGTAALVALSRKIARLAYALLRDQTDFRPKQLAT